MGATQRDLLHGILRAIFHGMDYRMTVPEWYIRHGVLHGMVAGYVRTGFARLTWFRGK